MWSGRFRQPLDPGFERWQRLPRSGLLHYELEASAHARALGMLAASSENANTCAAWSKLGVAKTDSQFRG
jgi:hypothetical protein